MCPFQKTKLVTLSNGHERNDIMYLHYRWIKSHQINIGLLSDKEYIITSRKQFCEQYIWLIENGYEPHCLDETFVNGKYFEIII